MVTGETFPADGIVFTDTDLQVGESSLTGESYPVRKRPVTAPAHANDVPRVGHEQWVFAGTRLLTGRASLLAAYIRDVMVAAERCEACFTISLGSHTPFPTHLIRDPESPV